MTAEERRASNRDKMRRWRAANPERAKASSRRAYETNLDAVNARSQAWYAKNKDRVRELKRAAYEDPETLERHRLQCRLGAKRWRAENPAQAKAHKQAYRARRRGAPVTEVFTTLEIAERDGWVCHICGSSVIRDEWSIDHIVPLKPRDPSVEPGHHTRANVKLAHFRCNAARGNRA